MKYFLLVFVIALWSIVDAMVLPNDTSLDARYSEVMHNRFKISSRHLCDVKCRRNPDDCSNEARRDLKTCEALIYRVFRSNYRTCMYSCENMCCSDECRLVVDCERICLEIVEEMVYESPKTPDELIRSAAENEKAGKDLVYVS